MASTVISDTQTVKEFRCNNCGSALDISKSSKGRMICPYCKTECVVEGLVKNSEILAKENINCGIPLTASPETLHNIIVSSLKESDTLPLDVFDKIEVIKEERYCIPAYCFDCNGTANFVYEIGNTRQRQAVRKSGNETQLVTENYTEWTHMSGASSATATLLSSGNKEFASQIQKFYQTVNQNLLVDVEELDFPNDVLTYNYNFPQSASFNQLLRPSLEKTLEQKAIDSISANEYRNFSISGNNIQKENEVRVLLGMYRLVYKYDDKEYNIWVSADGSDSICDEPPVDIKRKEFVIQKQQEIVSVPKKTGWLIFGLIACLVLTFFTYGVSLLGAIPCGIFLYKKNKERKTQIAKLQSELDAFIAQLTNAKNKFMQENRPLHGIYEKTDFIQET